MYNSLIFLLLKKALQDVVIRTMKFYAGKFKFWVLRFQLYRFSNDLQLWIV